jgi:hypothetical protein
MKATIQEHMGETKDLYSPKSNYQLYIKQWLSSYQQNLKLQDKIHWNSFAKYEKNYINNFLEVPD